MVHSYLPFIEFHLRRRPRSRNTMSDNAPRPRYLPSFAVEYTDKFLEQANKPSPLEKYARILPTSIQIPNAGGARGMQVNQSPDSESGRRMYVHSRKTGRRRGQRKKMAIRRLQSDAGNRTQFSRFTLHKSIIVTGRTPRTISELSSLFCGWIHLSRRMALTLRST
jgi:hypothetical protein